MTSSPWHSAFAPATIANLGPGFDVLGAALDPDMGLGDTCRVRLADHGELRLRIEGDGGRLPTAADENCATVVAQAVLDLAGVSRGLDIELIKGLPLGSGLGSSAASSAAAALATNAALGNPFAREQLLDAGRAGEGVAAGTPHPDNVVPALLGGMLLMVDEADGLSVTRLPVPDALRVAVVIPDLEVRTADARAVLPARVPMADAIANVARVAQLVSGLYDGDFDLIGSGVGDRLHQPYRIPLTRGFESARDAALQAGACGVGMSGSGPAMFALARGDAAAQAAGQGLVDGFAKAGVTARFVAGRIAAAF